MRARNGASVAIVALALGVVLTGCAHRAATATLRDAMYAYSCCSAGDTIPVREGEDEVMTLHWIATVAPPGAARPALPVTLAAALTGPFPDVAALKVALASSPRRSPAVVAVTVRTTDQAGGTPVSTLRLPTGTRAGLYDLTTTVASAGGTMTGDSVIQVGADTKTG
jgi:hypothetical protein